MTDEDKLRSILKLANELSAQNQLNQEVAAGVQLDIADLKQKSSSDKLDVASWSAAASTDKNDAMADWQLAASESSPGDETSAALMAKYTKLLQSFQSTVSRNQHLERDCKELQALVKEYESSLEGITAQLRSHTTAMIEGQARLKREYEALLEAEKGTTTALLFENMALRDQLDRLGSVLRNVYGDLEDDSQTTRLAQLETENKLLRESLTDLLTLSHTASTKETYTDESGTPPQQPLSSQSGVVEAYFTEDP